ncbi:tigger transposable element-derived protein 2 isoform X2 [Lingula anatina]|nr:tigger transposable element-derived protein 2 isoform X2 [Lingula anatina]XP_013405979.1 tigger transposable element-derived protein 2 isoform X2 [Lingula anatina]XP_013405980.1 tigger transposable element-derived protein 2 isoform X2 [Lingula anatina]|eukprot:XP_013405978.1 tigger transposable element-derived protein 2 isoform X2 [Lingula anatina]
MPWKYNLEQLDAAVLSVQEGTYTLTEASCAFGVPVTTIGDHVSGRLKGTPKKNTIMTPDDEETLIAYAMLMADWGFPLTRDLMGHFAKAIMKERDPTVKFLASDGWWWRLRQRHPKLSLRKPGLINRGRAVMAQPWIAESHFDLLKETLALHNITGPSEIYNADETYFQSKASVKVVAKKGKQFPCEREVTNANHVTVVECGSAAGQLLPPMIIFEGCPPAPEATQQGPEDALYGSSESGYIDSNMYLQWFVKIFLKHAPSARPLILFQHNLTAHASKGLIDSAKENDIILFNNSAYTSHFLQPLDQIFKDLKLEYRKIAKSASLLQKNLLITKATFPAIFKSARRRALTPVKVAASFKMTGVYPFNPQAIKADKFIENNRAPKKTKTSGDVCSLILECSGDDEERKDQTTQTYYDDNGQPTDKTDSMTQTDSTDTTPVCYCGHICKKTKTNGDVYSLILECSSDDEERKDQTTQTYYDDNGQLTDKTDSMTQTDSTDKTPVCYCGHICKVEQHPMVEMGRVSPAITKVLIVPAEGAPLRKRRFATDYRRSDVGRIDGRKKKKRGRKPKDC